jgi:hypothetical protein
MHAWPTCLWQLMKGPRKKYARINASRQGWARVPGCKDSATLHSFTSTHLSNNVVSNSETCQNGNINANTQHPSTQPPPPAPVASNQAQQLAAGLAHNACVLPNQQIPIPIETSPPIQLPMRGCLQRPCLLHCMCSSPTCNCVLQPQLHHTSSQSSRTAHQLCIAGLQESMPSSARSPAAYSSSFRSKCIFRPLASCILQIFS